VSDHEARYNSNNNADIGVKTELTESSLAYGNSKPAGSVPLASKLKNLKAFGDEFDWVLKLEWEQDWVSDAELLRLNSMVFRRLSPSWLDALRTRLSTARSDSISTNARISKLSGEIAMHLPADN
jgi:hypothetical protein